MECERAEKVRTKVRYFVVAGFRERKGERERGTEGDREGEGKKWNPERMLNEALRMYFFVECSTSGSMSVWQCHIWKPLKEQQP